MRSEVKNRGIAISTRRTMMTEKSITCSRSRASGRGGRGGLLPWKLSVSVGARPAMPPPTSWNHRLLGTRISGESTGARTSMSSAGSVFSPEVMIPEGEERAGGDSAVVGFEYF